MESYFEDHKEDFEEQVPNVVYYLTYWVSYGDRTGVLVNMYGDAESCQKKGSCDINRDERHCSLAEKCRY